MSLSVSIAQLSQSFDQSFVAPHVALQVKHVEDNGWNFAPEEAWLQERSHWLLVKEAEKLTELWKQNDVKAGDGRGRCEY